MPQRSALLGRLAPFSTFLTPLLVFAAACGDVASVSNKPDPIGTGGTEMGGTGGSSASGGTGGGIVGIGGTSNSGGEGNDGGGGPQEDAVCGNDRTEVGELCDDGNTDDDDGCSADCKEADPDFLCTEGQGCVRVVTCGNGVIEGDEVCDDGNTDGDDGCTDRCDEIDDGFICVKPGVPCVEQPECGNGVREQGEQCDDKNADGDDGCSDACQLEDGYFCAPGVACVRLDCGDGNRTPDEACDDGNDDDGDGCAPDCTRETGWLCSASGCKADCGDGLVLGPETCDDGNAMSGDGCSSACKTEPFYDCDDAEPTHCQTTIVCGDGNLSPGEVCDPGITGQEACYSTAENVTLACKGFDTGILDPAVCNNGVVEYMEECDGGSGNIPGCTNCALDDGYVCPTAGVCFKLPVCGDALLQAGEQCDLGMVSGPGCVDCEIQPNYFCAGEPSVCTISICGDDIRAPDEECDDGGTTNGDGCHDDCTVEDGYACPPGADCLVICGDGVRMDPEECDLGNSPNATACRNCRLQPGYKCGANGLGPCVATVCGNAAVPANPVGSTNPMNYLAPRSDAYVLAAKNAAEPSEGCDDGNTIAGDGCGPTCQLEPKVHPGPSPTIDLTCGDGLKTGSGANAEECDDGNTTDGDGCSSGCDIETGWLCDDVTTRPSSVTMAVTYHDFAANGTTGGHPHFENVNADNKGIAGEVCTPNNQTGMNPTCGRLDSEGKPQKASGSFSSITPTNNNTTATNRFATWYRDSNTLGYNVSTVQGSLPLTQVGGTDSDIYEYDSALDPTLVDGYFPLDGEGLGNTAGQSHNFHFTTELRYFFKYTGGEKLIFRGDDDVWVFINGRLAVDVGGVHCAQAGQVVLGDEDGSCTLNGADYTNNNPNNTFSAAACATTGNPPACDATTTEQADAKDDRFDITKGGVYEIVLFHAERHTSQSNFRLTLSGFLAPRSSCHTDCGDGIVTGSEMCDVNRSMPLTGYNVCLNDCTIQFCGDKKLQGSEACDNGTNGDIYGTSGCAPGCKLPAKCGDGVLQANQNEECDKGTAQNTGAYGGCTSQCKLGPYCGDDEVTNGEQCDTPGEFETYGQGECNYNCQNAPYCGDNVRNGPEICDGTANCNATCEFDPFCGDGLKTMNEECDYGQFNKPANMTQYGGCTDMCDWGARCGDSTLQSSDGEECDDGDDNADNVYDGCTTACLTGPHCGDGVKQSAAGEACDNGFNEDDYAYPGSADPCGKDCKAVPSCGDGKVQSAFELCDDGDDNDDDAYDGCTTSCDWGPYCGDSKKNGPEQCDDGPDNKAYSADGKGCSYECKNNLPYCGDGVRNGPEQCDDGEDDNDGRYGGCNDDCTRAPYCGDRKVQKDEKEQCDDGPTGSLSCNTMCKIRDGGVR